MGNQNSKGPSQAEIDKYYRDLKKWKEDCACMEAEEEAQRARASPDVVTYGLYCLLQGSALCFECPIRSLWHQSCCCITACCFLPIECFTAEKSEPCSIFEHHFGQIGEYVQAARFMFWNMCFPCDPHFIYAPEVHITRPPKPISPFRPASKSLIADCGQCFQNCCECHDKCKRKGACDDIFSDAMHWDRMDLQTSNRDLISKFLLLSLWNAKEDLREACHLSACFGPCTCFNETTEGRIKRWNVESAEAEILRTSAFWDKKLAQPNRYSLFRSDSGQVLASVVEEYNNSHGYLYPWSRGLLGSGVGCLISTVAIGSTVLIVSSAGVAAGYGFLPVTTGVVCGFNVLVGGASGAYGLCGDRWKAPSQCHSCFIQGGTMVNVEGTNVEMTTSQQVVSIEPLSDDDIKGSSGGNQPLAFASPVVSAPEAQAISRPVNPTGSSSKGASDNQGADTDHVNEDTDWSDAPFTPSAPTNDKIDPNTDSDDEDLGSGCSIS